MRDGVYDILSLGAGVQSSVVLLMSCRGDLPKLDAAIFADTGWEPGAVYEHLAWLEGVASDAGIPVHRVSAGNIRRHTVEGFVNGSKSKGERYASMPLHVLNNGTKGMIRRQCTREYKIEPIERFVKTELLGLGKRQRWPVDLAVRQWFGISVDEQRRVRASQQLWKEHVYPLIGIPSTMLPTAMTRQACIEWLRKNYAGRTVHRSSCIGCPFHSDAEWRHLRDHSPGEWQDAVEVDRAIRNAEGMDGQVFLHRSCVPLDQVKLDTDGAQDVLWREQECSGYCGD